MSLETFFSLSAGLLGLVVGSFANVVIHRVPLEESIAFPPSRCPSCRTPIKPWQNIPILSWLALRGACASCWSPISIRYPLVEAVHGLGFAAIVARYGVSLFTPVLLLFFFSLVVLALIDWDHQILPDVITLPGIALGVAASLVPGALVTIKEAALAAVIGYVSFFLVAEGYARLRHIEGLGMGDWKLAAMMGAVLGARRLMLVIFLASLSGMIYGLVQAWRLRAKGERVSPLPEEEASLSEGAAEESTGAAADESAPDPIGRYKLPFGTFLAAAAVVVLLRGDAILRWYGGFFVP